MNTIVTVSGMTCDHCINAVTEELMKLSEVTDVKIQLDSGTVDIESDSELNPGLIESAIQEAGYEVKQ
jgi:copper chaperone CopZ